MTSWSDAGFETRAIHAGQADVEDDRIRVLIAHGDEPTHTIGFDGDDIARAFEVEPQDISDRRLVLDDEDERLAIGGRQGSRGCDGERQAC